MGLAGRTHYLREGGVFSVEIGMSDVATYTVHAKFKGETHSFPCRADQTVLNAAEAAGITLPSTCCSGVCTTCDALGSYRCALQRR